MEQPRRIRLLSLILVGATLAFVAPLYGLPENTLPPAPPQGLPAAVEWKLDWALALYLAAIALAVVALAVSWARPRLAKWPAWLAVGALAGSAALGCAAAVEWPVDRHRRCRLGRAMRCRTRLPRGVRDGAASIGRVASPAVKLKPEEYLARPQPRAAGDRPADRGAGAGRRRSRARGRPARSHGASRTSSPRKVRSRTRSSPSHSRTRLRGRCVRGSRTCSAILRARSGSSRSTPRAGGFSAARRRGSATSRTSRSTTRPTRSG